MSHYLSSHDHFHDRGRMLEAVFFQKRDAELLAAMRTELAVMEEKHKLAHVSGILDPQVLLDLVRVGVTAESLLAMRYVPLIRTAWADGAVSEQEREAILAAAADEDVAPGTAGYQLIARWLQQPPAPEVVTAWKEYVGAMVKLMPAESLHALRQRSETLCERVARATGGILGMGKVSAAERAVMQEFASVWSQV